MALKTPRKTPQKFAILTVLLIAAILILRPRFLPGGEEKTEAPETQETAPPRAPASAPSEAAAGNSPSQASATPLPAPGGPKNEKRDQALAHLQDDSKLKWQPVHDPETGGLRTLEGGSLEAPSAGGEAVLVQNAQAFVERYASDLFGVTPENLHFDKIVELDRSKVIFEQHLDGRRVLGATLALIYEGGALVRVQNDLAPETLPRPSGREVALEQAIDFVTINGGEKIAASAEKLAGVVRPVASIKPELVYFPRGEKLISAYTIYVDRFNSANERVDRARVLVDAVSPRILRTDRMTIN